MFRSLIFLLALTYPTTIMAQHTPDALAELWVEAIKKNDTSSIRQLVHPKCNETQIAPEILTKMVQGDVPANYKVKTSPLGPKETLARIYAVIPEMQLTLKYDFTSQEEKERYGLGKGYPIAQYEGKWYFTICLRELG